MLKQTPRKRVLFVRRFTPALLALFGVFSLTALSLSQSPTAYAVTASTINFQARLQGDNGSIVPDADYNIQFKLYDAATNGNLLWTETYLNQNGEGLTTLNGYFSVQLGSLTSFPSTIDWSQQLYMTMNVGGSVPTGTFPTIGDGEMTPRMPLTAVPYAFQAGKAANADQLIKVSGGYTSTLGIQNPTVGNQTFVIQDQGAAGTYNLLTAPSGSDGYIKLQGSSPGTVQTGNFNISGTGIANTLQAANLDRASSGTLNIGTSNATAITFGSNSTTTITLGASTATNTVNIGNGALSSGTQTINIGTGATSTAVEAITIGSLNAGSSVTLQSGTGSIQLLTNGGSSSTKGTIVKSVTNNSTAAFQVQNASGTSLLNVDTTNSTVSIAASLSVQKSGTTAFQVLNGSSVPQFTVDSSNSYVYIGNPSSDTTGALLILDTKADAGSPGDPTGVNGGMYYNSNRGRFRCYERSAWFDCIGAGGIVAYAETSTPQGSITSTANLTSLSITPSVRNGHMYRFTGQVTVQSNAADTVAFLTIQETTIPVGLQTCSTHLRVANTNSTIVCTFLYTANADGTQSLRLQLGRPSGGTLTADASIFNLNRFWVEDMGVVP